MTNENRTPNKHSNGSKKRSKIAAPITFLQAAKRGDLPRALVSILDEHKYVQRLLLILEDESKKLGESSDYDCLASVMHYMTHYPDVYHHPKEDLIFKRLNTREPEAKKTIDRLYREHEKIIAQGASLLQEFLRLGSRQKQNSSASLRDEVLSYAGSLREHMALEERAVFSLALRQFKASDWAAIDTKIAAIVDPIFGNNTAPQYPDLLSRYLSRTVSISRGSVPVRLLESTASRVEKAFSAGMKIFQLPLNLSKINYSVLKKQNDVFKEFYCNPSLLGLRKAMRDGAAINASGSKDLWREIQLAFSDVIEENHPLGEHNVIPLKTDADFLSFKTPSDDSTASMRISWQAALSNLVLRMTLKQFMASMTVDRAQQLRQWIESVDVVPEDIYTKSVAVEEFDGLWVHLPKSRGCKRTILLLPGGGYFFPAVSGHVRMLEEVARQCQSRGMIVNYRLAPEHPFPAGLEDAMAAYRYLLDSGVESHQIALLGDSAGGGLAISLLLSLKEQGLPLPVAAGVISPFADLSFSLPSRQFNQWRDPMLATQKGSEIFTRYIGDRPVTDPLLSPVYGHFSGFPPMLAQVCSTEILLDDTLRVARKARSQGVEFEVEIWEGLPHDFQILSFIPESKYALSRMAGFFSDHFSATEGCFDQPLK